MNKVKEVHPAVAQLTQILNEKDEELLKLKMEVESLRQQLKSVEEHSIGKEKFTNSEKSIGDGTLINVKKMYR